MKSILANITGQLIVLFAQIITAVRPLWRGTQPQDIQRVYCGNHTSNGDFVLIWAALPPTLRHKTRPVAASDYWLTSKLRAFIGRDVFRAVLINRDPQTRTEDPVTLMSQAVDNGASLIIFPEGKRNMGDEILLPLKSGIFHLASQRPQLEFVPVWINNLNRAMPKGEVIPLPLLCSVSFGAPLTLQKDESKEDFLARMRTGMLALAPKKDISHDEQ